MIRENGAMVLNATLVDRRNMKCDLVAPVVPIAVPVSSEAGDEEMRESRNVSECEAPQIPVLEGAREVNRSKQPTESERRRHELSHPPHVPWCTICCRARTIDDAHHVVIHEESVDSLPKIACDHAEIMMKGDTTPMRVKFFLSLIHQPDILEPQMLIKRVAVLALLQNGWQSGWNPLAMHE